MAEKQTATYEQVKTLVKAGYSPGKQAILVNVKGHPILEDTDLVRTSVIERLVYNDDKELVEIHTRNTIYTKAEPTFDPAPVYDEAPEEVEATDEQQ